MIETGKVMAVSQRGTYLGRRDRAQAARRPHAGRAQAAFDGATLHGRGEVAQLVEHTAENRGVAGSSPALAIASFPAVARRAKAHQPGRRRRAQCGRFDGLVLDPTPAAWFIAAEPFGSST